MVATRCRALRTGFTSALILLMGLAAVPGCTRSIVKAPDPIPVDAREYGRLFDAAALVLRDEGFIINRKDYRFGVVSTRPLTSPTVFEFWHRKNTTGYQVLESTLNAERRTAVVTLEPQGQTAIPAAPAPNSGGGPRPDYLLRVEVLVERQQYPLSELSGSTSGVVSGYTGQPEQYSDRNIAGSYWEPLSHDPYMEQQLISEILRRSLSLAQTPAEAPSAIPVEGAATRPAAGP